jgi:hypothetical protein
MPSTRFLSPEYDLAGRPADRRGSALQACGDIIERTSGKSIGRVYGHGGSRTSAEGDVVREAERWLVKWGSAR